MPPAYAIDTNLYISASRDPRVRSELKRFTVRMGTRLYLSAVVVMELRAGAKAERQRDGVEVLYAEFMERDRVIVPSSDAYLQAGRVLADLVAYERVVLATAPKSLTNDVLIATSCREADVHLVTANHSDFAAIARHLHRFHNAAPWP